MSLSDQLNAGLEYSAVLWKMISTFGFTSGIFL